MINLSIKRLAPQTAKAKDMKRKTKTTLLRNLLARKETKLSRRNT
jgi:hypothetical protein